MRIRNKVALLAVSTLLAGIGGSSAAGRMRHPVASTRGDTHGVSSVEDADVVAAHPRTAEPRGPRPRVKVQYMPTGLHPSQARLAPAQRSFKVKLMLRPAGGGDAAGLVSSPRTIRAKVRFIPTGTRPVPVAGVQPAPAGAAVATDHVEP